MTNEASPRPWRVIWALEDEPARVIDSNDEDVAIELTDADARLVVDAVNEYTRRENWRKKYIDRRMKDAARLEELYADISDLESERDRLRDIVRRFIDLFTPGTIHPAGTMERLLREARAAIGEDNE